MHKEAGERRDFLPQFVATLCRLGADEVLLEEEYGSGIGIPAAEYSEVDPRVRFAPAREVFDQDVVVVVRCPDDDALGWLRPGSLLISMLHFPTRPGRIRLLDALGVHALSLDSVKDDRGRRLIENFEAVGWYGVDAAFNEMARMRADFTDPQRPPIHVTCLGAGAVGAHAVRASAAYGNPEVRETMSRNGVPGVEVTMVDFDLTRREDYMLDRLARTDLLIDATNRLDPRVPVVPNRWLGALSPEAILLDLSSDPYLPDAELPIVKGIEGVPHGDLDQWVFQPDDPAWDEQALHVDATNRRVGLSCSAWPGIHPGPCMEIYGAQVEPLMALALRLPTERWSEQANSAVERAAARGELSRWRQAIAS